jgi:beta-glucanase (GH16 family)
MPTLTLESTNITAAELLNDYTVNLTSIGTCSGNTASACVAVSNTTIGSIINPVRSARLTTVGTRSITYGKVEVVAKMPKGDWLWPAIWWVFFPCSEQA